jgi:hypothetical protein
MQNLSAKANFIAVEEVLNDLGALGLIAIGHDTLSTAHRN